MIRNRHILEAFERDLRRRSPNDIARNLRILDGLGREAVALGVWPPKDSMPVMDWVECSQSTWPSSPGRLTPASRRTC